MVALDVPFKFKARTLDGENFTNDSVKGKVLLIQFWATWCPYCRRDAPAVDAILDEFDGRNLVVLAVDVAESKRTVTSFLAKSPRNCKIVLNEDTNLVAWFDPKSFPHYVAVNRFGRVVAEQSGSGGERRLRNLLTKAGLGEDRDDDDIGELLSSPRRL